MKGQMKKLRIGVKNDLRFFSTTYFKSHHQAALFLKTLTLTFVLMSLSSIIMAQTKDYTKAKRSIVHVFDINATTQTVGLAVSTISGLKNWWTQDVTGSDEVGKVISFRFADRFKPDMKVVTKSESHIQWQCVSGEPAWANDYFTFSIEENGTRAKLTFVQEYANEITNEQYGRFNFDWGYYLNSLKLFCETGKGKPFAK